MKSKSNTFIHKQKNYVSPARRKLYSQTYTRVNKKKERISKAIEIRLESIHLLNKYRERNTYNENVYEIAEDFFVGY